MPLPVGHSLLGYATYDAFTGEERRTTWRSLLLIVVVANLPDIDFLPGFLMGEPNRFHRHYLSHSLGAAIVVGALLATFFYVRRNQKFASCFLLFFAVYFSHVALDYFGVDKTSPLGVPMFWPLTSSHFMAPIGLFMSVHKSNDSGNFFRTIFVMHNLWATLWELAILLPVVGLVKLARRWRSLIGRAETKPGVTVSGT